MNVLRSVGTTTKQEQLKKIMTNQCIIKMRFKNIWINNRNMFLWLYPKFSKMNEKSNIIRQTHDKVMSYKSGQATHLWNHLFGLAF